MEELSPKVAARLRAQKLLKRTVLNSGRDEIISAGQLVYKWESGTGTNHYTLTGIRHIRALKQFAKAIKNGSNPIVDSEFVNLWDGFRQIYASVQEEGVINPLLVWQFSVSPPGYVVLRGNQRLVIARNLGIEYLPCIVISNWRDEKMYMDLRPYGSADNPFRPVTYKSLPKKPTGIRHTILAFFKKIFGRTSDK